MATFRQFRGARHAVTALVAAGAMAVLAAPAQAQSTAFNFYVGGGIGQSNADLDDVEIPDFDEKDFAWKLFAGVRMASIFGAELDYINFGKPDGSNIEVKYKGLAAYGLVYLPLPLPLLDVYAKAGLAKIDVDIDAEDFSTDDTQFTYGLGAQLKFGSLAIRGEYERFKVKDGDVGLSSKPSLLSLSFSKSFF
jgi:opacity protein-like surface antigen